MKKFVLLALLMSTVLSASAQWVTIPDENFANALNSIIPECMDGNQMNTSCPGVTELTWLDVNSHGIEDLTGVQYFTSLTSLFCGDNQISSFPDLPWTLNQLICSNNQLTSITYLPSSLTYLEFENNLVSSLPALPNSLEELHCNNNQLTTLPELPTTLQYLRCAENLIESLPELPPNMGALHCFSNNLGDLPALPESLTYLYCEGNQIASLPELPETLTYLRCQENELTSLPDLPTSLYELSCQGNQIVNLPQLPESLDELNCGQNDLMTLPELPGSLTSLFCYNNSLTALPQLPEALETLNCSGNQLTGLPELPEELAALRCQNNQLQCLPIIPMSLTISSVSYFNISNNPFTCLPNYVPAMDSEWLSYPLCDLSDLVSNPFGCASFEGIAGSVFEDDNTNCQWDEPELGLENVPLQVLDAEGDLIATTYTLGNKIYNFVADTGSYSVQLLADNTPFQPSCDDPGDIIELTLTASEPSATDVNFGVVCIPGFDVGVQQVVSTGWVFPGQLHTLNVSAGDLSNWYGLQCAAGTSSSVTVNITGPVSYLEPAENALTPIVSGDLQLTYEIADFGNVDFEESFDVILETDTTAQAGDLVCIEVIVEPIEGDANPENNIYTHCYEVVNSYDPNIKQVWPQDVEPGYDGYFNYTIYFQNTGTAPAFNIRVADTLDTNLDLSTFQVTGYSHDCLTYVSGNVATFRFNNIILPDSTSDFEGSIGYVQYRIKPLADLPVGTVIENTAHIFFDFNDAIVTNTTQNEYVITTSAHQPEQQLATVFPNPGTGQFNVLFRGVENGLITHLEVYNLSGKRVLQRQVNENRVQLDLSEYPSGMYLLHLRNARGSEAVKLMKQ